MKKLFETWCGISLVKRIVAGLIIGAVLGLALPQFSAIAILGSVFVGALKAVAPLLVFFLVISSLCHSGKSHGGVIRTVIILYMFSTFLAAVIAVIASMMFPITLTLAEGASDLAAPEGIVEVLSSLLLNMVSNPVQSIASANYIGVLVWAVLFGIGLRGASETTKNLFGEISNGLARVVTWIISFAPFGILGLVFNTVSENGLAIFTEYGKLLAVLVGSMLFIYFVTNPILVFWCIRRNPYPLIFKCLKKSAITAFFTRSSAANIPINMETCEEMGLDKDTYSVTIPLGATINMDGTAIYQGVCVIFIATCFGVDLTIGQQLTIILTATLASIGTAGVPGAGMIMLAMVLQSVGLPVEGIALVAGIDRIFDMGRTTVNITGDAACTLCVSKMEEKRQAQKKTEA